MQWWCQWHLVQVIRLVEKLNSELPGRSDLMAYLLIWGEERGPFFAG